jgi:hypothetical protein
MRETSSRNVRANLLGEAWVRNNAHKPSLRIDYWSAAQTSRGLYADLDETGQEWKRPGLPGTARENEKHEVRSPAAAPLGLNPTKRTSSLFLTARPQAPVAFLLVFENLDLAASDCRPL